MLTPQSLRKEPDPRELGGVTIKRQAQPGSFSPFTQLEMTLGSFTVPGRPGGERLSPEMKLINNLRQETARLQSQTALLRKEIIIKEAAARAAGYEAGRQKGAEEAGQQARKELEERMAALQKNFTAVLQSWEKGKDQFYREAEGTVLPIIGQMVQMILHREIQTDPQTVVATIQAALKYASERSSVTVKVNPRDYRTAADQQHFWLPITLSSRTCRWWRTNG
jgi:flagellar biosynthesis/type III secretory pathway protein FliH